MADKKITITGPEEFIDAVLETFPGDALLDHLRNYIGSDSYRKTRNASKTRDIAARDAQNQTLVAHQANTSLTVE